MAGLILMGAATALAAPPETNGSLGQETTDEDLTVESSEVFDAQEIQDNDPSANLTPAQRLHKAQQAFARADYPTLFKLLKPIAEDPHATLTKEQLRMLLPWYAAGLVVNAQQETVSEKRQNLYERARKSFIRLLEIDPDYELEELLYPEQVVVLFDSIAGTFRRADGVENDSKNPLGATSGEPVYIEKEVTKNQFALVFLPFGVGQFQNGDLVTGTLAASIQVASLVTNITSFIVMEQLRSPTGFYRAEDFRVAKAWRTTMYTSLGTFVAAYLASVVDAWVRFKPFDVNIRVLDGPPEDLTRDETVANFHLFRTMDSRNEWYRSRSGGAGSRGVDQRLGSIQTATDLIDFTLGLSVEAYW